MCHHKRIMISAVLLTMLFWVGCASTKQVSTNETPKPSASIKPTAEQRDWSQAEAQYSHVGVENSSLYMQDPFENKGSEDQTANTWDWDSFFSAAASPFIFVGNIVLTPIEAIFNPPWKNQVSRDNEPVQPPVYELSGEPSRMAAKNQWKMPFEKDASVNTDPGSEDK